MLFDEAYRRAMGYRVPVYYKGVKVGTMKKYSDTLLIPLLKQMLPEYYGEITPSEQAQKRAKPC